MPLVRTNASPLRPLKGLIFDGAGNRMSPSHTVKGGVRYRYYVSQAVLQGRAHEAGSIARLPAHELEQVVIHAVSNALAKDERTRLAASQLEEMGERDRRQALRRVLRRIEVSDSRIGVTIDSFVLGQTDRVARSDGGNDGLTTIELPFDIIRRDNGARVLVTGTQGPLVDSSASALVKAVARGYAWRQQLLNGNARSTAEIAQKEGVTGRYVARLLRLGFLAPDIIASILAHRQPAQLIVDRLRGPIPFDWNEQRRLFGFDVMTREIAANIASVSTRAARTHMCRITTAKGTGRADAGESGADIGGNDAPSRSPRRIPHTTPGTSRG
jgi:hypothetical protein